MLPNEVFFTMLYDKFLGIVLFPIVILIHFFIYDISDYMIGFHFFIYNLIVTKFYYLIKLSISLVSQEIYFFVSLHG